LWRIVVFLLVIGGGKLFAGVEGGAGSGSARTNGITAEEIVRRMVARADEATNGSPRANYVYFKKSTTEKLNGKGNVEERKEKLIQITGGKGSVVQIKVNGKPLSAEELKKAEAEVQAEDQKMNDSRVARRSDNFERLLTGDLVSRYRFELVREELLNGRRSYVLNFRPAAGELPVREMSDRFINNLRGVIWVDAEEYEIAKADLALQSEVTLWGGILGALRKFDYKVERVRVDDGVWFNRLSRGEFAGRKFLDNVSLRTRSECTNFERIGVREARSR
ncbi:MAG TPA: hypothetical protein VJ063_09165, partial [Verrucomicrobiae bacterium]|nr:hypothetical protein [Verrucomicrobiae bacterium]